jgi:hypothetical protein
MCMPRRLFILALALGGCAETMHRGPVVTSGQFESIRRENDEAPLFVEVPAAAAPTASRNKQPVTARSSRLATLVEVRGDQASLALSGEGAARIVPARSVDRIVVIHRGQGAGFGAATGLCLGVAAYFVAAATYSPPACANSTGCVSLTRDETGLAAGVLVGVPAMIAGALIGAAVGTRSVYTFGDR